MLRQFIGDEYSQRKYIEMKVKDICQSIADKGERSPYDSIFQMLAEQVEDEESDV